MTHSEYMTGAFIALDIQLKMDTYLTSSDVGIIDAGEHVSSGILTDEDLETTFYFDRHGRLTHYKIRSVCGGL